MTIYYDRQGGMFRMMNAGGEVLQVMSGVAVLYDNKTNTLHRHGDPELVREDYDRIKDSFPNCLVMIESRHWDIGELNSLVKGSDEIKGLRERIMSQAESGKES